MTSRQEREALLDALYQEHDKATPLQLLGLRKYAKQFVPGDGILDPKLILVGEAPGAQEDKQGAPFVGPSGKLLDKLLVQARLRREEVWITNVVKYRPPRNRTPEPQEVEASLPLLAKELRLVAGDGPRTVVGLGRVACSAMAHTDISVTKNHGTWRRLQNSWVMYVSFHPAAGLRSALVEQQMQSDFLQLATDIATSHFGIKE